MNKQENAIRELEQLRNEAAAIANELAAIVSRIGLKPNI